LNLSCLSGATETDWVGEHKTKNANGQNHMPQTYFGILPSALDTRIRISGKLVPAKIKINFARKSIILIVGLRLLEVVDIVSKR
jgi:hypothetical protein